MPRNSDAGTVATVPTVVLGWYSTVTRVAVIGMLLAIVSAVLTARITPAGDTHPAEPTAPTSA